MANVPNGDFLLVINTNLPPFLKIPKSLYLATPLAFNPPSYPQQRGSPGTISVKFPWMSTGGQGTKWRRNIAENFNRLSMAHERRQTIDGPATAYSER